MTGQPSHPDVEIMQLVEELNQASQRERQAELAGVADDELDELVSRSAEIASKVFASRPKTLDGFKAQARALAWCSGGPATWRDHDRPSPDQPLYDHGVYALILGLLELDADRPARPALATLPTLAAAYLEARRRAEAARERYDAAVGAAHRLLAAEPSPTGPAHRRWATQSTAIEAGFGLSRLSEDCDAAECRESELLSKLQASRPAHQAEAVIKLAAIATALWPLPTNDANDPWYAPALRVAVQDLLRIAGG